ncbi:ATP-binding protein [Duganella sp.]|uniref:ATP-binding protein n=1 Tax=Duganella sp. TaxID=1904440 RepID=UPI0031D0454E
MFANIEDVALRRQLLIALALVGATTGLQLLLSLFIGARTPFMFFIPTVALAAALLGRLAAAVVLFAGVVYGVYILGPTYEFWVDEPADRGALLAFVVVGTLFGYLGDRVRLISRRARSAEAALSTERVNSERDTLATFQEMFDQAPGFMTMLRGPDHVYVLENESHRNFHGHRNVIGIPIRQAFPELAGQGIIEILDDVYRSGVPRTAYGVPVQLRRQPQAEPEQLYMDFVCQPLRGKAGQVMGIFVEGFDVTEQKVMRDALRVADAKATEADQRLQLAVDAAGLGVFYCPLPLNHIYWNDTCKAQFFLPPEAEVDAELFYSLIAADDRDNVKEAIRRAVEEGADYDVEYRTVAPDGRSRWIRAKGRVYRGGDGTPARFDGITIDIQQQKEAEAALQTANRQKDDFLAMLAHELRNPLAPISSAATVLMRSNHGDEQVLRMSQMIDRQVKHMAGLLDDLLDVSRVTRGKIVLDRAPVDLKTAVADAAEQVLPLIKKRSHQLTMHLAPERTVVSGDAKRLVQVFVNLLMNAARYTPEGGVIDLLLSVDDGQAEVQVRDNGIGLKAELIPQLFDLFVQGERAVDRQQGGLGIGLSLVKRLTELHGGTVAVHSPGPGQGSRFIVRLPLAEPALVADAAAQADASAPAKRITIVDDNEDAAQALAALLRASGHKVTVEHDPLVALNNAAVTPAEAFLLDIGMPVMDGYTLARRLRELPATRDARIIAVSGYGQEQDRQQALSAGFDALVVKPADLERLSALLD